MYEDQQPHNERNQRNQMSAQDLTDASVTEEETEQQEERNSDLLASKLSKELNNCGGGAPRGDRGTMTAV